MGVIQRSTKKERPTQKKKRKEEYRFIAGQEQCCNEKTI